MKICICTFICTLCSNDFFFSAYLTMRVAVTKSTLQQQWKPPLVFAAVNHVANLQLLNNLAVMSKRQSALLQMRMIIFVAAKMECVGGSFGTAKLILSLENYAFFPSQLQKYSYDCKLQLQRLQNLCLHLQTPCIFAVTNVCSLELQYNFIAKCHWLVIARRMFMVPSWLAHTFTPVVKR